MSMTAAAAKVAAKKVAKLAARKARQQARQKDKGKFWVIIAVGCLCAFMSFQMIVGAIAGGVVGTSQGALNAMKEAARCDTTGEAGEGADAVYASNGSVRLPVTGKYTVTSDYGMRVQPVLAVSRLHAGIDLATIPTGGKIVAPKAGTVQSANANVPGAGNFIVLDHGGGLTTRYLHLSEMNVKAGDKVKVGQTIGKEGNTTGGSGISTGAHLHFEVKKNDKPTDPRKWLKDNGVTVPAKGSSGTAGSKTAESSSSGDGVSSAPGASSTPPNSASNAASSTSSSNDDGSSSSGGGSDFSLPEADMSDVKHAGDVKPLPIPEDIKKLYEEAGEEYGIPWELLAGVGMEETKHGRIKSVSTAGAAGVMQFMPAAWLDHGIDGDGDGDADIDNPADSIHSAANKLASQGAKSGADGVKKALMAYNRASWYGNDVLHYAHEYGNGNISVSSATSGTEDCIPAEGDQNGGGGMDACVTRIHEEMDSTDKAGQLVMAALSPGSSAALDTYIDQNGLGNVLYLGGWKNSGTVKSASDHLQDQSPTIGEDKVGMLLAADQEGGEVQQLTGSGFSTIPSAVRQARMSNLEGSAKKWGKELKDAGVNVNLAPSADTVPDSVGESNAPIGELNRQYGATPAAVSKGSRAFASGMQDAGVEPVVKHFPGIGRITGNTDLTDQGITDSTMTTSDDHLEPFKQTIDGGAKMVMVGSADYSKIDPDTPALFSEKIVDGMLRDDMGFDGIVMTDDVGAAEAVSDTSVGARATKFIDAGGDIVLTASPEQVPTMVEAIESKASSDSEFSSKVDEAVKRVLTTKGEMDLLPEDCTAEDDGASGEDGGDTQLASTSTSDCEASGSPGEKGLQPAAREGLRCGVEAAPWVETTLGVGERAGDSDHGSGNAVDFMVPKYESSTANKRGWELAKWMKSNADELNVKYVIFDQKIWNPDRGDQWRPMEDRGSDTQNHRDHIHVSFD